MDGENIARIPQGWYRDPMVPRDRVRWWDGNSWTQHVRPLPALTPTPPHQTADFQPSAPGHSSAMPERTPASSRPPWLALIASALALVAVLSLASLAWVFLRSRGSSVAGPLGGSNVTLTGTVEMTRSVAPASLLSMGVPQDVVDDRTECPPTGWRVNIRDGSGEILASPVGEQVQVSKEQDGAIVTLVCLTTYTATVPREQVYRISTQWSDDHPEDPLVHADITRELSQMPDGQVPALRMMMADL